MIAELYTGDRCLEQLPKLIHERYGEAASVLLVHGKTSFFASGADALLYSDYPLQWEHFDAVKPNPEVESVAAAAEKCQQLQPAVVVAVGGGSVIDTAKGMLALSTSTSVDQLISGDFSVPDNRPLFVAVPTTAGSGSEATHFSVLYRDGVKYSIAHQLLRPDIVLLDPTLLRSCPEPLSLAAGADAVCQCVESLWNKNATDRSRELALEGLQLLLPVFFERRNWDQKLLGAHRAGQAIDITKTTAGHALSYGLTSLFGIPHGFAVLAVMQQLVATMTIHDVVPAVTADEIENCFSAWGAQFISSFQAFAEAVWERHSLRPYLAESALSAVNQLTKSVNLQRLANHPVLITEQEANKVYETLFRRHNG